MIIGNRLKEARIKKGLSQEALGNLLGVSKVSICGYETGTRTPNMKNFLELIKILELDTTYTLGEDVKVVKEDGEAYSVKIARDDLIIIESIKSSRELYNMFCENPSRTVEKIKSKLNI